MRLFQRIPFEPDHINHLVLRECDAEMQGYDLRVIGKKLHREAGHRETLITEDIAVMCGGLQLLSPGRAEAWVLLDVAMEKFPIAAIKTIRGVIYVGVKTLRVRRLEANVHEGHTQSQRMMGYLGFHLESYRKNFFPDGATALHYVYFPKVGL